MTIEQVRDLYRKGKVTCELCAETPLQDDYLCAECRMSDGDDYDAIRKKAHDEQHWNRQLDDELLALESQGLPPADVKPAKPVKLEREPRYMCKLCGTYAHNHGDTLCARCRIHHGQEWDEANQIGISQHVESPERASEQSSNTIQSTEYFSKKRNEIKGTVPPASNLKVQTLPPNKKLSNNLGQQMNPNHEQNQVVTSELEKQLGNLRHQYGAIMYELASLQDTSERVRNAISLCLDQIRSVKEAAMSGNGQ